MTTKKHNNMGGQEKHNGEGGQLEPDGLCGFITFAPSTSYFIVEQ